MGFAVGMASTGFGALCTVIGSFILFYHQQLWLFVLMGALALAELIKAYISLSVYYSRQKKAKANKKKNLDKIFGFLSMLGMTLASIIGIKFFQCISTNFLLLKYGLASNISLPLALILMLTVGSFHLLRGYGDVRKYFGKKPPSFTSSLVVGAISLLGESILLGLFLHRFHPLTLVLPFVIGLTLCRCVKRFILDMYLFGSEREKNKLRQKVGDQGLKRTFAISGIVLFMLCDVVATAYLYGSQVHLLFEQTPWPLIAILMSVLASVLCVWRSLNSQGRSLFVLFAKNKGECEPKSSLNIQEPFKTDVMDVQKIDRSDASPRTQCLEATAT